MKRRQLLLLVLFFLFYAGAGSVEPMLSLFFQEKGFPLEQISVLTILPRLMIFFAGPLWAGLADSLRIHKLIFPLTMALSIPFALGMLPDMSYGWLFLVTLLFSISFAPVRSLCDGMAVSVLNNKSYEYGRVRAWGAIGYAFATLIVGFFAEFYGSQVALILFSIFMFLAVFINTRMKSLPQEEIVSFNVFSKNIFSSWHWIKFLLIAFLAGTSISMVLTYLAIYLKDIGSNSALLGFSLSVASLSAIPFFFLAPAVLKKHSPLSVMQFSMMTLALRCFLYTRVTNPAFIPLVQLLHGLSFSLFWSAGVLYVKQLVPQGFDASGQSIFVALYFGLGGVAGGFIGGMILANQGAMGMFNFGAMAALIGLLVSLIPSAKKKSVQN
ncbi:MAG: MFS transporter [Chloroflexi bacterium]|nr:MFS transporter [Chloroflexota bacterium]